jgi:hypothetical protein
LAGEFHPNQQGLIQEMDLLDFKDTGNIDRQTCQNFTGPCLCEDPLGYNFLCQIHPDIFTDHTCLSDMVIFEDIDDDSLPPLLKDFNPNLFLSQRLLMLKHIYPLIKVQT